MLMLYSEQSKQNKTVCIPYELYCVSTLKTSFHNANFVVTGSTTGCRSDNLRCCQWQQSWHHNSSIFSVLVHQFFSSGESLYHQCVHQSVKAPGDYSSMILLCCQKINNATWDSSQNCHDYTPRFNAVERGYTSFTLSVGPFVRLWTESYPLCIFSNTRQIHFIFAHLIKQLQKVCPLKVCFKIRQLEILANSLNL